MFCLITTEVWAKLALGENVANFERALVEKEDHFNRLAHSLEF